MCCALQRVVLWLTVVVLVMVSLVLTVIGDSVVLGVSGEMRLVLALWVVVSSCVSLWGGSVVLVCSMTVDDVGLVWRSVCSVLYGLELAALTWRLLGRLWSVLCAVWVLALRSSRTGKALAGAVMDVGW